MTDGVAPASVPTCGDRWIKLILALLLALGAWPWARISLSDGYVATDPQAALAWWPSSGEAALAQLESLAQDGRGGGSVVVDPLARTVLATAPLHGKLYAAMARARAEEGQAEAALDLFRIASLRAPRDKPARMWLVENLAARGEHAEALAHVDQLIRQAPRQSHHWMQYLAAYAESPNGRPALVAVLGQSNPPWRESFLLRLLSAPAAREFHDAVLAPLRHAAHPLTSVERDAWVSSLIRGGRSAEAYFLWIEGLQADERAVSANVHDGGFELPPDNGGFGWHWQALKGAFIGAEHTAGVTGERALSIEFTHRRVAFQHVWQYLMLPPAQYRLSGRARMDRLDASEGLRWEVQCSRRSTLAQTQSFRGNHDWKSFEVEFQVPPEGCPDLRLQLALVASAPAETWVGGRAWFDDLAIARVAPLPAAPDVEGTVQPPVETAQETRKRRRAAERVAGAEVKATRKRRLD